MTVGQDILNGVIRSVTAILFLLILTRILGKKQIAQLNFFDYVVGISIGSVSGNLAFNLDLTYPRAIAAMTVMTLCSLALSYFAQKNKRFRQLLDGKPLVIIDRGQIIRKNIDKARLTLDDVLEEMRQGGIFHIDDVEFAILETSGQISIQMKSGLQKPSKDDLGISATSRGLSINLIMDGQIIQENMLALNLSEAWLRAKLQEHGLSSAKDVLLACIDAVGTLYVCPKERGNLNYMV